ncbi:transposable element Tcb2 transposase [Trichonephila clavipes]|nr:transposable element Tcb2 transposase [Trichonephila clavipes]
MPLRRFRRQYEQLTQFDRWRIIGMTEDGRSARRVACQLGHSYCVVAPSQGYSRTIRRLLIDEGRLGSRCPLRVLPLMPSHQRLRLEWCRARENWTAAEWNQVVFSDESRFNSCSDDNRMWSPVVNASILPLLYRDTPLPQLVGLGWYGVHLSTIQATTLVFIRGTMTAQRKTTRREDRRIVRQALVDPTVTRSTIRADVGVAIIPQKISRHLAEANLKSKRPFRALPLTPEHRQLRLQWCQARSMWNVTDWQKVVFSDESRFVLGRHDNRVRVWRRPGAIFQQDNARPPTARVAQDFLSHFQTLPWPARSADLSPVEHVWDQLKRQVPSCHSVHDLELAVQDLWAHLPQDNIRCLINSMPDRGRHVLQLEVV